MEAKGEEKLSGIVFNEPLSSSTEGKRRMLLFTASFSILLTVYGLKVTKTPWLDIEVPEGAPNILHGAMSVALLYSFAVFVLYSLADLRRWFTAEYILNISPYLDSLHKSKNFLDQIKNWVENSATIANAIDIGQICKNASAFFNNVETSVKEARKDHRALTVLQWIRLSVFDLGIPLFLGIFAMIKIGPSLIPFLQAL